MGRSVVSLCAVAGLTIGGFIPAIWGDSGFSLSSILFSILGGIVGIWVGVRLSDV